MLQLLGELAGMDGRTGLTGYIAQQPFFTGCEWLTREEAYDYFINRYLLVFMGLECVD